ncbi:hypothetical protein ERJ75_000363900 [Trypanosoma vivax]|nr:hypothetical protein ERJ75_000363900 [Trypanosoma vivax]
MCTAGVHGGASFEHYFLLKAVRRRCSKLTGGLFQLNDVHGGLPANAVRQGKRWLSTLLDNKPVTPRMHRPTSATLATDAFMYGWGALLFKDSGEVRVADGAWEREPRCISQGEARAASLAPSSFAEATAKNLHICIGNARSDALVREPSLIHKALQEQAVQASWTYIASAENPADEISRGNSLRQMNVLKVTTKGEMIDAFSFLPFVIYSFLINVLVMAFVHSL